MESKNFFDISILLKNNIENENETKKMNKKEWKRYIYEELRNKIRCNYINISYTCEYKREEKMSDIIYIQKYRDIHKEEMKTLKIKIYCNNNKKYNIYIKRINIKGDAINGLYFNKFIYFIIKKQNEIVYNFEWNDEDMKKKDIEQIYEYQNFNELEYLKKLIRKIKRTKIYHTSKILTDLEKEKNNRRNIIDYKNVYQIFNILEKHDREIENNKKKIIMIILIIIMKNDKTFYEKNRRKKLEIKDNISTFKIINVKWE